MKLVIHAHALKNESLSQAITGHFDERGGTIGRSDTNTLTLPDPERHVSRLQAEVLFAGRAFSIRNVGSANPIELNGRTLRPGEGAPLAPGDQLVIGGYAMRVVAETQPNAGSAGQVPRADSRTVIRASAGEARTDPPPRAAAPVGALPAKRKAEAATPSSADPFADLMGGSSAAAAADPFGDLMDTPAVSAPVTIPSAGNSPAASASARMPDDFDPFADIASPPQNAADAGLAGFRATPSAAEPAARKAGPQDSGLDDLLGLSGTGSGAGSSGSSLDAMFGLGGQGGGKQGTDLLDEFLAPRRPAADTAPGDVLDLFADKPTSPGGARAPAAFNHTPELAGAYAPPVVKAAPPPAARKPPAAAPAPVAPVVSIAKTIAEVPRPRVAAAPPLVHAGQTPEGPASPEALWRAFCEGAGITLPLPQGLNAQMMRVMGQVMHHAVEGALKLVAARSAAKQELRAQVTTIQSKNNNPLKFAVDPPQALAQLLQPPMRGFMPGPDAVRDAMDDLLGHNIGTMAGTRAALQGMLKRFEPARLEAKLTNKGVIDAVLPMNRRAKLWELYVEHYQQVQDEAQDDFHELFGKAFVKAYEQQLDRLEASRRKAG
jgi:FHA domain-containing protein